MAAKASETGCLLVKHMHLFDYSSSAVKYTYHLRPSYAAELSHSSTCPGACLKLVWSRFLGCLLMLVSNQKSQGKMLPDGIIRFGSTTKV